MTCQQYVNKAETSPKDLYRLAATSITAEFKEAKGQDSVSANGFGKSSIILQQ